MTAKHIRLAIIILVFVVLPGVPGHASSLDNADNSTLIATVRQQPEQVRTDGERIVWHDVLEVNSLRDVWVASLSTREPHTVTSDADQIDHINPDISGDLIVWTESADGDEDYFRWHTDVRGRNTRSGLDLTVADSPDIELLQGISGDWVVWTATNPEGTTTLYTRQVYGNEPPRAITTPTSGALRVFVSDGYVAWNLTTDSDRFTGHKWQTFVLQLDEDSSATLVAEGADTGGVLGLGGSTLLYREDGFPIRLKTLDLVTGVVRQADVPFEVIAFDGRYAFTLYPGRYSPVLEQAQLLGHDLATGATFEVDRGTELFLTQGHARNGAVVWTRGVEIHAARVRDLLPSAPRPEVVVHDYQTWYPETGHTLGGGFRDYWTSNGGLPVFGYPLTEEFLERNTDTRETYTVQFTERQRFEWHPENLGTPYQVLLGRLGSELLTLQGRDWTTFPKADPDSPHYLPETGQAIAPEFWNYWSSHGLEFGDAGVTFRESLALFGYPLSKPMIETNNDGHTVLTQYFERAVFEYHPDNHDPYKVLLRRLGAEMLVERGWMDAPDAVRESIAFVSTRDGNAEIYIINADGSGMRNLTRHPANDYEPQWSPDGSRILFTSDRSGSPSMYVMDADGSNVVHLTPEPGTYSVPRWSPDGSHIAYAAYPDGTLYDSSHLYVTRVADLYSWQVSANPWVTSLSWAPDGTRIAYATSMYRSMTEAEQDSVIHVVNVDGTNDFPLTLDLGHATDPVWSPDGSRIAFFQGGIASGMPWLESLQTMDPYDGTNRLELATCGEGMGAMCYGVRWSPDSAMLAFHRNNTRLDMGDSEILLISADGSGQRVVYTGDLLSTPSWSSDGMRLVFTAAGALIIFDIPNSWTLMVDAGLSSTFQPDWQP